MKFTVSQKSLAFASSTAARFISKRSPMPVMRFVKVDASDTAQTIKFSASGADIGGEITIEADSIEEGGSILLDGSVFASVVKSLTADSVTLQIVGSERCLLTAGSSKFELATLAADLFPTPPSPTESAEVTMSQPAIKKLIDQAVIAAAGTDSEARSVMTGVCVSLNLDRLTMVSTDGRRMSVVEETVDTVGDSGIDAVIPADALRELGKALSNKGGSVIVRTSPRTVRFILPNFELHCRLLEGRFPDHNKVLPTSFERMATLNCGELLQAVRRLVPLAQEKRCPNLLRLHWAADSVTLSANTPDVGSGEEVVSCSMSGNELVIGFNGKYLAEGLSVIDPESMIHFDLQADDKSAILRQANDNCYRYVCMPVKLNILSSTEGRDVA